MQTPHEGDLKYNRRPAIATVEQAAAEITRLFRFFDSVAVDLTPDYWQARLTGEKRGTWTEFPGPPPRRVPILNRVIRRKGCIEPGAGVNIFSRIVAPYHLRQNEILMP